jgi:predicted rRNA methylase YqxC with S4 and FtsJ domains
VLARITEAAAAAGFERVAMTPAAITGATGNQEFFLHLRLIRDRAAEEHEHATRGYSS